MVSPGSIILERSDDKDVIKDISTNAANGNASVVNSPLTECKYAVEKSDNAGSSSSKEHRDSHLSKAGKEMETRTSVGKLGAVKPDRLFTTRYFIIKSLNHQNIQLSIEKGIWATQVMNEPILEEAFDNSGKVILIFSVNMSGFFQGYARMMSSIGWRRENVWSEASGGTIPWGRTFKVKWLQLQNLPFQKTLHLKNPLNGYKPVKISRDCQELTPDIGEALCRLIDESLEVDERLMRNTFSGDEVLRRSCVSSPVRSPNERYMLNVPPSHMRLTRTPVLHPSSLYQQVPTAEPNHFHVAHGRSSGRFPLDNLGYNFEASKVLGMLHSQSHGSPTNLHRNMDPFFLPDKWNLSSKKSVFLDSLSEDDFLEMTYEEYLQVLGRRNARPSRSVAGPSWSVHEPPASRGRSLEDRYSHHLCDLYRSQRRNHFPSPN
ncbi:hypothetical protein MKW94_006503 [Papaver nudicaule]|uniref:YTH domain-containing family protein n=1 Tax=Papaver nudicaule TaxID=74823 RepID=A0AA41SAQ4_PAPNU|nr:hypothetical protein [Papaver nudicaule]